MQESINTYVSLFSTLNTNRQKGIQAPHKAILLLSVIDMIESGAITTNKIELSEHLENHFKNNWKKYVGNSVIFSPKIGTPFFHLSGGGILEINTH